MPRPSKSIASGFADIKSDYAAMQESRFRRRRLGVSSMGGSADTHYVAESRFIAMREYVRAMDRDDFLIGPLTDRCIENQVQSGYDLEVQTGDKDLNDELWAYWKEWSTDPAKCDTAGVLSFADMERLVARQEAIDGDILAVPITDESDSSHGTLQLVEADRCRTPTSSKRNIVHGVELDSRRRRLRYYVIKDQVDATRPVKLVGDTYQIDAFDGDGHPQVFHVFKPTRVSQTRGVTAFKAVVDLCGMIEDTNFATVVKQQIAACAVWSWEKTEQYGSAPNMSDLEEREAANWARSLEEGVSPGQMFRPPKGLKLNVHAPQGIPSEQYLPHMRMLLTFVGMQIGMPLIIILMDASETNFSGWRGAWDQAKIGFRNNQRRRATCFYSPVWRWKVRQFLDENSAARAAAQKSGINIFSHKWSPPSWPYIQPEVDAKADAFMTRNLLESPRGIAAKNSRDIDEVIKETVEDNAKLIIASIEAAQAIKKQTGVEVGWRDVANRDLPQGAQGIDTIEAENTVGGEPPPKKKASV